MFRPIFLKVFGRVLCKCMWCRLLLFLLSASLRYHHEVLLSSAYFLLGFLIISQVLSVFIHMFYAATAIYSIIMIGKVFKYREIDCWEQKVWIIASPICKVVFLEQCLVALWEVFPYSYLQELHVLQLPAYFFVLYRYIVQVCGFAVSVPQTPYF